MAATFITYTIAAVVLWITFTKQFFDSKRKLRRLPGPCGFPLIGNVFQLPKSHEWLQYTKYSQIYGPVFALKLFGTHVVVINNHDAAIELLEKRSAIYSDRPRLRMAGELVGWDNAVTLHPSSPRHRNYRKLLHTVLSKSTIPSFYSLQYETSVQLLLSLSKHPDHFRHHIRTMVGTTVAKLAYGFSGSKASLDIKDGEVDYIALAESAQANFSLAATPYAFWVDFLPILAFIPSWFPFAKFKRKACKWRSELMDLCQSPFELVKSQMENGTAPHSYVSALLTQCRLNMSHNSNHENKSQERDIMWSALSLYTGGADTTTSAIATFFLAMTMHPKIQTSLQQEVDSIVYERGMGEEFPTKRLPTFEDRSKLPLVDACVKEVLRWRPVIPLGVAHRLTEDNEWNGYHIPKGSTV